MVRIIQGYGSADRLAASMFEDRRRLFVDLLKWDLPVVDGRFEIDRFDGDAATYLIAVDHSGNHIGSLRLLPTTGPHILGDLFAHLCDGGVPRGQAVLEITRLCLPVRLGAVGRLAVRNRLISAMVDHALRVGTASLTGVVKGDFLKQILQMGWRCTALGAPKTIGGAKLGAFRIDLDADTPRLLATAGIYVPGASTLPSQQAA